MIETLFQEELAQFHAEDLYRKLRVLQPVTSTHALWNQKELVLFCGNDYLGLSHHPRVIEASKRAADRYGVGAGAARLISGTSEYHELLELELGRCKKKGKALVFSAGYLANLGVLTGLADEKDVIVMDKLCHASLIDGARLSGATLRVFPHKHYERCESILKNAKGFRRRILVSDTVFSMDGDLADFERLIDLKKRYDAMLVLDDAHGTGVFGIHGGGALEDSGLESEVDVITGTLSKSLGCLGGFAAASESLVDYFINVSRPFIFATALAPHLCAAALEALRLFEREPLLRHRLWQNIQKTHAGLTQLGFQIGPVLSPIIPIVLGEEKQALRVCEALLERGILIPAIRYPTVPKGKARLRLTVSASHEDRDFNRLFRELKAIQDLL